jgi:hypothetical protein
MSKFTFNCSLSVLALIFAGATVDVAEAGGNGAKRKQRSGASQMMRLGGPTNGTAATTNGGFVDRTGGPNFRSNAEIKAYFDERVREGTGRD